MIGLGGYRRKKVKGQAKGNIFEKVNIWFWYIWEHTINEDMMNILMT
jgi:hypothetical protein